ncbi:hypothetical protein E2C01_000247 [Portunus trituberculatus]|uniref:Uncharacterized protein n=1 Tax=Portunus trituberculatus TaxID=210409 RepID=A0A5B7CDL0_PORTR|nr:hypothetical protein [Portunus trituberculatus]
MAGRRGRGDVARSDRVLCGPSVFRVAPWEEVRDPNIKSWGDRWSSGLEVGGVKFAVGPLVDRLSLQWSPPVSFFWVDAPFFLGGAGFFVSSMTGLGLDEEVSTPSSRSFLIRLLRRDCPGR